MILAGALLSGCVGSLPIPGGSMPLFGGQPYYGSQPYYGGYGGPRYRYVDQGYYDSRSARALAEAQARAREQLRRDQQLRRNILTDRQQERREFRQEVGDWRKRNARYQRQQRKNQSERFQHERKEQRKWQDGVWSN